MFHCKYSINSLKLFDFQKPGLIKGGSTILLLNPAALQKINRSSNGGYNKTDVLIDWSAFGPLTISKFAGLFSMQQSAAS